MPEDLKHYEALRYRFEISFDQDSEAWVIRYPELPGCIAHGESEEEALVAGREAKSLWLETALENHDPIPAPVPEPVYSGKTVVRLPRSLHERAARAADRDGVSLNTYLVQAVAESVERSGIANMLRFIGGALERELRKLGAPAFLVSLFVQPIYGEKDQPVALEQIAELPGVPSREDHAP